MSHALHYGGHQRTLMNSVRATHSVGVFVLTGRNGKHLDLGNGDTKKCCTQLCLEHLNVYLYDQMKMSLKSDKYSE